MGVIGKKNRFCTESAGSSKKTGFVWNRSKAVWTGLGSEPIGLAGFTGSGSVLVTLVIFFSPGMVHET
jgi:hypothetical protein